MSNEDFIDKFTTECLTKGICKPREICEVAQKEIEKIDKEIERLSNLRIQKDNYTNVLKSFGFQAKTKGKQSTGPALNKDLFNIDDEDPSFYNIIAAICREIEKSEVPLTSRKIISVVGCDRTDPSPIYISLKWLLDRGVLQRNEDRTFLPGENWEDRLNK